MKDTLIIISGGGFSQLETSLGCLKALEESGKVELHSSSATTYQATSAGAIASGMMMVPFTADQAIMMCRAAGETELIAAKWGWPLRMWFGDKCIYDRTGLEKFMKNMFKDAEYSNVMATITRQKGLNPEYLAGRYETILASTSIEGIFPATVVNKVKYIDGGYSDNVPLKDWQLPNYKHTYIILYPNDPNKGRHQDTSIGRLLVGFGAKLSQEVNEAERTYDDKTYYPNVTVLRPPPTTTSLLSFSEDFKLLNYSYRYAVEKLQKEGLWK